MHRIEAFLLNTPRAFVSKSSDQMIVASDATCCSPAGCLRARSGRISWSGQTATWKAIVEVRKEGKKEGRENGRQAAASAKLHQIFMVDAREGDL